MRILLPLFMLISGLALSQEFKLTADNFKNKSDETKNFVVLEFPGKTQSELFKKVKIFITGKYKGIKNDGYNEVENDQIVLDVRGSQEKTIIIRFSGSNVWSASNRYEINFKDGKVMIKPLFRELDNTLDYGITANISSLFNKKGDPKKEKAIEMIEFEANSFVSELKATLENSSSSEW